ncbi:hypothetical protein UNSWDHB_2608 [Dehalobacter sp. UNSWDHB]|uniref:hypothetical protein n=1 Tax=Dehalobacter sp. UNSWDHB TaxID=1339256 RepID=UPI0003876541|nr:hypothetical protein [Dehalobacter sp. UNSWDHB]EQB20022.1 hypothetical protein UNSWDHB_2608 [Dehalobacter sp. UNSWDHB]
MKVGLIDVDSHNFPNLPLMKISAYQKRIGNTVEWWRPEEHYGAVYASKVFSGSELPEIANAEEIHIGGSGVDLKNSLPDKIEHITPDYTLYPQYGFALGFLTRGCPRLNHKFCITPEKDGCISRKVADLSEFWAGQQEIVLLDQNLLACKEHRIELLRQLAASGAWIEFNGGIDARFISEEIIAELRNIKVKDFHFAWDDPQEDLEEQFSMILRSGIKNPDRVGVYVLTNYWSTIEQDLRRIYTLRRLGFVPFPMIYDKQKFVDKNGRWLEGVEKRHTFEELRHFKICQYMQRWAGNRKIIKLCPEFADYDQYRKMLNGDRGWLPKGLKQHERSYSI